MKTEIPIIDHDLFTFRKLCFLVGLVCFILGIVIIPSEWNNLRGLILLVSIFLLFGAYFLNQKYKEYKKVYQEYLPNDKVSDNLNYGSFGFTNEYLNYQIKKISYQINWTEFNTHKLINNKHIILFNKDEKNNLIISETEMDKSDFIKAVEFIKERV